MIYCTAWCGSACVDLNAKGKILIPLASLWRRIQVVVAIQLDAAQRNGVRLGAAGIGADQQDPKCPVGHRRRVAGDGPGGVLPRRHQRGVVHVQAQVRPRLRVVGALRRGGIAQGFGSAVGG